MASGVTPSPQQQLSVRQTLPFKTSLAAWPFDYALIDELLFPFPHSHPRHPVGAHAKSRKEPNNEQLCSL
jgi:hypothetical protein